MLVDLQTAKEWLRVAHDEPALWGGTFRVIQLVKPSDSAHHARS